MSTFDGNTHYFSGQGVVLIGLRDATGRPKGLVPVGNVSALKLGLASTVLEHKESQTGNRAIDLRLNTETKSSIQMTVENFNSINLATVLNGTVTLKAAGTLTGQVSKLYMGKVMPALHAKLSSVVVKRTAGTPQALTLYTNDTTAYDYKLNTDSGSVMFNDGSIIAVDKMTTGTDTVGPNAVAVSTGAGEPTTFTWAATPPAAVLAAGVGGYFVASGLSGADAALLNNLPSVITAIDAAAKTVKVARDTFGNPAKVITIGTPKISFDGDPTTFDYSYATQNLVDAMVAGNPERYLRFEGLNTAEANTPVVVEVFRFLTDPLKELALIGEGLDQFVLDGNVLSDSLQATGSKFFKITQLN